MSIGPVQFECEKHFVDLLRKKGPNQGGSVRRLATPPSLHLVFPAQWRVTINQEEWQGTANLTGEPMKRTDWKRNRAETEWSEKGTNPNPVGSRGP